MLPERDAWGERLPRHLGLWSAVAVLVGSTIGSGIFRVPASVAERLQERGYEVVGVCREQSVGKLFEGPSSQLPTAPPTSCSTAATKW